MPSPSGVAFSFAMNPANSSMCSVFTFVTFSIHSGLPR